VAQALTDQDVPAWWQRLGIPGLFDVHVHVQPPRVMAKVRAQFDSAGPLIGRPWPLEYRGDDEELLGRLHALGVRRFSALPYAHRPGIAEFLNDWAAGLADRVPQVLRSATLYPEEGVESYVADRIGAGTEVFKVHVQVGDFDLTDPLLDRAWGLIEDAGTPVVIHANSGPVANAHTGPGPMRSLLGRHPRLTAVLAHMGAPEYAEFLALAEEHDRVHLDTTMAFTDFFEEMAAFPRDLLPRLRDVGDRVLLGSDFPNIPYPYAHQLESLERLGLGDEWLRGVCWDNPVALFGEPGGAGAREV
jgi:predicted TIM-barrel fold metal-dependent hydrolase